ncbi:hypothetical protein SEUCBS139899_008061 [Sporothrix eucalyptigena]|uniref:DUF7136 domain-containing protein n=1 Tax=Sporothrix eucalyptigena TaxID=1812306 RepID=A0ABP0CCR8_9PEZI
MGHYNRSSASKCPSYGSSSRHLQQVNISLVYPRNETYDASTGVLPVVFAITNANYALTLHPFITLRIYDYANRSSDVLEVAYVELTGFWYDSLSGGVTHSGDLVYLHHDTAVVSGLEGLWSLEYTISITYGVPDASNTSMTTTTANAANRSTPAPGFSYGSLFEYGSVVFSTKKGAGAAVPDLVTGTANTSCAAIPFSQQITVTDVLNEPCYDDISVPKTCPVIANDTKPVEADHASTPQQVNITMTGYGCGPTVDASAALAISSSITSQLCFAQKTNGITCPPASTVPANNAALLVSVPGMAKIVAGVVGAATATLLL